MPKPLLLSSKEAHEVWMLGVKALEKQSKKVKKLAKSPDLGSVTPRTPRDSLIALTTYQGLTKKFHIVAIKTDNQTQVFAFDFTHPLGEPGAQGTVYLAQQIYNDFTANKNPSNIVVVKHSAKTSAKADFANEISVLKHLDRFRGFAEIQTASECFQYLFSEYCEGKNLLDVLYQKVPLTEEDPRYPYPFKYQKKMLKTLDKLKIANLIMAALHEIHHKFVLHRDLKTANVIVTEDFSSAKLVDFGTSSLTRENDRLFKGSPGYQDPAMILPLKPTQPATVLRPFYALQQEYFSLGIILLEVLSSANYQEYLREMLFKGGEKNETYVLTNEDMQSVFSDVLNAVEPSADSAEEDKLLWFLVKFCQELTQKEPTLRPSSAEFERKRQLLNQRLETLIKLTPRNKAPLKRSERKFDLQMDLMTDLTEKMARLKLEVPESQTRSRSSSTTEKPTSRSKTPPQARPILNFSILTKGQDSPRRHSARSEPSSPFGTPTSSSALAHMRTPRRGEPQPSSDEKRSFDPSDSSSEEDIFSPRKKSKGKK
ncbi:MAG: protein kinase family protein [Proteobacteria bacterium]|nr:protein kinase family protein [Pseudomonadota bacterium]